MSTDNTPRSMRERRNDPDDYFVDDMANRDPLRCPPPLNPFPDPYLPNYPHPPPNPLRSRSFGGRSRTRFQTTTDLDAPPERQACGICTATEHITGKCCYLEEIEGLFTQTERTLISEAKDPSFSKIDEKPKNSFVNHDDALKRLNDDFDTMRSDFTRVELTAGGVQSRAAALEDRTHRHEIYIERCNHDIQLLNKELRALQTQNRELTIKCELLMKTVARLSTMQRAQNSYAHILGDDISALKADSRPVGGNVAFDEQALDRQRRNKMVKDLTDVCGDDVSWEGLSRRLRGD